MNRLKEYLQVQKDVFNLIPKTKQPLLYNGLESKLNKAIDNYIRESFDSRSKGLKSTYDLEISLLNDRVKELESLCNKHSIKHSVSPEEVYNNSKYKGD